MEPTNSSNHKVLKLGAIFLIILVVILVLTWGAGYLQTKIAPSEPVTYEDILDLSSNDIDQTALQDFFANQVASGINDEKTRSAVHWLTHRYFDNGGNIYELYDFIETHPEVAFLKEAEKIYPDIFANIKIGTVARVFSYDSLFALLAYYETIDRYGYGSIALWGTAANKYAEQAIWSIPENPEKLSKESLDEIKKYTDLMLAKAENYGFKARFYIYENAKVSGTLADLENIEGLPKADLLVGLNQYASAILNLKSIGVEMGADFSPFQIFEFNSEYARKYVPRLYLFTNYLFATALVYSSDNIEASGIELPLDRVVSYVRENNNQGPGTIKRILESKSGIEKGVFDYNVTKKMAAVHPGFKQWLLDSGWTETDF